MISSNAPARLRAAELELAASVRRMQLLALTALGLVLLLTIALLVVELILTLDVQRSADDARTGTTRALTMLDSAQHERAALVRETTRLREQVTVLEGQLRAAGITPTTAASPSPAGSSRSSSRQAFPQPTPAPSSSPRPRASPSPTPRPSPSRTPSPSPTPRPTRLCVPLIGCV